VRRRFAAIERLVVRLQRRARAVESWTEWIYPYRRLHLTRAGWFFLLATIAIGLAALNTGHNLFYLIFAMLVSLIVVSGLLSERTVRFLQVERRTPAEIFARSAAAVELRVRNRSRRWTSYAVEIRAGVAGQSRRRVGFIDRLDPGAERSFVALWSFPRRGRRGVRSIHLVTRFPFGFFEKVRIVPVAESYVVFPALTERSGRFAACGPDGQSMRKHRLGEEIVGLRRKLPDDDPRRIHWRSSVRTGEWMVTERADASSPSLSVFFDDRGEPGAAFESAVEHAATLLWQASRAGRSVRLYSWAASFTGEGRATLRSALGFLAEVEPASAAPVGGEDRFLEWRSEVEHSGGGVFVTAGAPPALPSGTLLRVA
jgi:uncharacterized protein (DUF58 family)